MQARPLAGARAAPGCKAARPSACRACSRGFDDGIDGVDGASRVLAEVSRRVFMVYMRM
jgi:hypothetical protein